MSITVKDVMGRVAIAVLEDARFADIVAVMKRYAVSAVAVIDVDRRPVGVVSQDDLLLRETDPIRHSSTIFETHRRREEHAKATGRTAAELMTSPAVTVTPGTPVREAARLMHEKRIRQLPVVHPVTGRIVGTVHQSDLLRIFERPERALREEIAVIVTEIAGPSASLAIEIDSGVIRLRGEVERESQAIQLAEAIRRVEGVIDVDSLLTFTRGDLTTSAPPTP